MNVWFIYTVEYYLFVVKKNKLMNFIGKFIELENIILREVTQTQKDKGHIFSLILGS